MSGSEGRWRSTKSCRAGARHTVRCRGEGSRDSVCAGLLIAVQHGVSEGVGGDGTVQDPFVLAIQLSRRWILQGLLSVPSSRFVS